MSGGLGGQRGGVRGAGDGDPWRGGGDRGEGGTITVHGSGVFGLVVFEFVKGGRGGGVGVRHRLRG